MKSAVNEVWKSIEPDASENDVVDCQVSVGDLWHKQEYSLMKGFVSVISTENKKVIDYQKFSTFCKECLIWEQ